MASPKLSIKRHNHRVYFSAPERKNELLEVIIAAHPGLSIAVVTGAACNVPNHVTVAEEISEAFDLLIIYDAPLESDIYINRLAFAKTFAFVLIAPEEQSLLYPIETILGRTLVQERLEGFADPIPAKEIPFPSVYERDARDDRKPKNGKGGFEKKPAGRKPSGFVKKDENGKPIFSKKSGERNHRYDGTPKTDEEKAMKKPFKPKGEGARHEGKPREERSDDRRGGYEGKKPFKGPKKPFGSKPGSDRFDDRKGASDGKRPYEGKRPYNDKPREERSDERRGKYDGKKPFDGPKKAFDGPKKPFGSKPKSDRYDDRKGSGEGKRPYEGKPKSDRAYDKSASGEGKKPYGEGKKPFDKSKSGGFKGSKPFGNSSKPHSDKPAAPKRAPKKFALKAPKPSEKK